jgi:NADH-quinone oxidoreductase subunit M
VPGTNGFVGEFLVLIGSFKTQPFYAIIAATSVIFAAAYMLWALQRIIYQRLDKPENEGLKDLTPREYAIVVPIIVMILWIGVYPKPFLHRIEASVEYFVEHSARGPTVPEDFLGRGGVVEGDVHAD